MIHAAAWLAAAAVMASAPPAALSLEANYWGKPLSSWTVEASGDVRYTYSKSVPGGAFGDYDVTTLRFHLSADEHRQVEALLAPARRFAGGPLPCKLVYTDGVYGTVSWSAWEQVSFNLGCSSEEVAPILAKFEQANALLARLSERGKVVERKQMRASEGGAPLTHR